MVRQDHQAVVLHFVGLRLDGHRPNRWKFPLDALRDSVVVDCVADGICLQVPLVWVVFVVFYVVCHGCTLLPPCNLPPPPPRGDRHFHVFLVNVYSAGLCCPSALRMALHCFPITSNQAPVCIL